MMTVLKYVLASLLVGVLQTAFAQWSGTDLNTLTTRNGNVVIGNTVLEGTYGSAKVLQMKGDGTWFVMSGSNTTSFSLLNASSGTGFYSWGGPFTFSTSTSGIGSQRMIIGADGNVGIGTGAPSGNLHVSSGTAGKAELRLESDADNNNENDNPFISFVQDGSFVGGFMGLVGDPNTAPQLPKYGLSGNTVYNGTKPNALFLGTNFSENLQFGTNGNIRLTINENGNAIFTNNVAIGTPLVSNPNNYKLAVNGKIGAKEVQVENTSSTWADYVFEPDYKLLSLQEVESFIKINKHLPEIPSAEEVKINGHRLGEMDVLLLKKVEELTLYMIEFRKEMQRLEQENEDLKAEIDALKKK